MKIRKANCLNLFRLKFITSKIVKNMNKNNIPIWNKYYPSSELKFEIKNKNLYILTTKCKYIGFYALNNSLSYSTLFNFTEVPKFIYLTKLCINPKYLNKGYASYIIKEIKNYAKQNKIDAIRLTVAKVNTPAINLYKKLKFKKVDGEYLNPFITKCDNIEYGFEYLINKN